MVGCWICAPLPPLINRSLRSYHTYQLGLDYFEASQGDMAMQNDAAGVTGQTWDVSGFVRMLESEDGKRSLI